MTGFSTVVAYHFLFAVESLENAAVFGSVIIQFEVSAGVFLIVVAISVLVGASAMTHSSSVASTYSVATARDMG